MENAEVDLKPLVFTEVTHQPESRSGHRIVCNDGNLYSIGGYFKTEFFGGARHHILEELWRFNFSQGKWTLLPTTGEAPKELCSHCAALYEDYLYVFGGTGASFGQDSSNKLTRCDLRSLKWEEVEVTGDIPEPQYGQALILDEGRRQLYVLGGTTGWDYTMDVHRLDLATKSWKLLYAYKGEPDPLPRYRTELGYDGANIYVFGGGTINTAHELDTIPAFNIYCNQWSTLVTRSASGTSSSQLGFPKPRKCHASVQLGDDVYICGGCNATQTQIYDDVWKFHIPTREWQLLPERLPIPLAFHTACVTSEGCMYVFGGVTDFERNVRTNRIFKMWLKTPKLKEQYWERVSPR